MTINEAFTAARILGGYAQNASYGESNMGWKWNEQENKFDCYVWDFKKKTIKDANDRAGSHLSIEDALADWFRVPSLDYMPVINI